MSRSVQPGSQTLSLRRSMEGVAIAGMALLLWHELGWSTMREFVELDPNARMRAIDLCMSLLLLLVLGVRTFRFARHHLARLPILSRAHLSAVTTTDLPRRARHEAAHAITALAVGAQVDLLTLRPGADDAGHIEYHLPAGLPVQERAWRTMIIALAGNQADLHHGDQDAGATQDLMRVLQQASVIISCNQLPTGYTGRFAWDGLIAAARHEADDILQRHQGAYTQLVDDLVAHGERRCFPIDRLPHLDTPITGTAAGAGAGASGMVSRR